MKRLLSSKKQLDNRWIVFHVDLILKIAFNGVLKDSKINEKEAITVLF